MTDSTQPHRSTDQDPDLLQTWVARLSVQLGLSPDDVDIAELLALAKLTAHSVARPAAPLTTFLVGLAAGRAGGSSAQVQAAIQEAKARAIAFEP